MALFVFCSWCVQSQQTCANDILAAYETALTEQMALVQPCNSDTLSSSQARTCFCTQQVFNGYTGYVTSCRHLMLLRFKHIGLRASMRPQWNSRYTSDPQWVSLCLRRCCYVYDLRSAESGDSFELSVHEFRIASSQYERLQLCRSADSGIHTAIQYMQK